MLGGEEGFFDLRELLERIQQRDSEAAEKLDRFFKAYEAWHDLTTRMIDDESLRTSVQAELLERISGRDNERQALLIHLNSVGR